MADEADRGRNNESSAGMQPDAAALYASLSQAGSSDEAREFLRQQRIVAQRQAELLDLQIKDTNHELKLRHWSMWFGNLSAVMKATFEIALALIFVAIVALFAAELWSAAHDDGAVIESFSVPPDLAAKGLTGEVVASKMLDRLSVMQSMTNSTREGSSYANNWGNDIKVQIPDTGVSIGEINRFLHDWLGHQTKITGDVYRTTSGIAVVARAGGVATPAFKGTEADLDSLIDRAARDVYRVTQPYRFARYLMSGSTDDPQWKANAAQAETIFRGLTQVGSAADRAWAYDGLDSALLVNGDVRGGIAMLEKSIAVKPGLDAYWTLAGREAMLHHEAQFLNADTMAIDASDRGDTFGLEPHAAALMTLLSRQDRARLLGDYLAALDYGRQIHTRGSQLEPYHFDDEVYANDLLACAGLHDPACIGRVQDAYPVPVLWMREADLELNRFKAAADDSQAVRASVKTVPAPLVSLFTREFDAPQSAMIAAHLGNFSQAHALIDATDLDCVICLRYRARIDSLQKNWVGAGYWSARAVAAAPSSPFGYANWGEILLSEGRYDAAIAKFREANAKGPHFADPLEMWGESLIHQNHSDLALAKFSEAAKYAPNWGRLHLKWGEALLWSGDKAGAAKQFAVASGLDLVPTEKSELIRVRIPHG
jgi:tetratricopeptide (TPR) repeat protein